MTRPDPAGEGDQAYDRLVDEQMTEQREREERERQ